MMMLLKSYFRSRLKYCCDVWSPTAQGEINEIEIVSKTFNKKLDGMIRLNLLFYSLVRRSK